MCWSVSLIYLVCLVKERCILWNLLRRAYLSDIFLELQICDKINRSLYYYYYLNE